MPNTPSAPESIDSKPLLVLVLFPIAASASPEIDYYYDFSQGRDEFARAFAALNIEWRWLPVSQGDFRSVIDTALSSAEGYTPVFFNLCDGDETNDVPGVSVIHYLDEIGVPYTGADAGFYDITTSKIAMKEKFDGAGVSTAPWAVATRVGEVTAARLFRELGEPLIVKPAVSAGSMGISTKSVVTTPKALREQVKELHDGYKGWNLVSGGVFVERYIAGREFTVMIVGSHDDRSRATIYPPVERVFHKSLPQTEQFLSYDRLWEVYEREAPVGGGEFLWEYHPTPKGLRRKIEKLSWDAYAAVGGYGYGRIDLRMDGESGELYVLEVNAQCGLSEDENYTSIGAILRFAQVSYAEMVREIIDDAFARRPAIASPAGMLRAS